MSATKKEKYRSSEDSDTPSTVENIPKAKNPNITLLPSNSTSSSGSYILENTKAGSLFDDFIAFRNEKYPKNQPSSIINYSGNTSNHDENTPLMGGNFGTDWSDHAKFWGRLIFLVGLSYMGTEAYRASALTFYKKAEKHTDDSIILAFLVEKFKDAPDLLNSLIATISVYINASQIFDVVSKLFWDIGTINPLILAKNVGSWTQERWSKNRGQFITEIAFLVFNTLGGCAFQFDLALSNLLNKPSENCKQLPRFIDNLRFYIFTPPIVALRIASVTDNSTSLIHRVKYDLMMPRTQRGACAKVLYQVIEEIDEKINFLNDYNDSLQDDNVKDEYLYELTRISNLAKSLDPEDIMLLLFALQTLEKSFAKQAYWASCQQSCKNIQRALSPVFYLLASVASILAFGPDLGSVLNLTGKLNECFELNSTTSRVVMVLLSLASFLSNYALRVNGFKVTLDFVWRLLFDWPLDFNSPARFFASLGAVLVEKAFMVVALSIAGASMLAGVPKILSLYEDKIYTEPYFTWFFSVFSLLSLTSGFWLESFTNMAAGVSSNGRYLLDSFNKGVLGKIIDKYFGCLKHCCQSETSLGIRERTEEIVDILRHLRSPLQEGLNREDYFNKRVFGGFFKHVTDHNHQNFLEMYEEEAFTYKEKLVTSTKNYTHDFEDTGVSFLINESYLDEEDSNESNENQESRCGSCTIL